MLRVIFEKCDSSSPQLSRLCSSLAGIWGEGFCADLRLWKMTVVRTILLRGPAGLAWHSQKLTREATGHGIYFILSYLTYYCIYTQGRHWKGLPRWQEW